MRFVATALLLTIGAPAWAALDADAMKHYGGTYLGDCKNPNGPKVRIFENDIVFLNGANRVAVGNLGPQYSYFGNSAPENYVVALVSEMPDGAQLIAIVYKDAAGEYIQIDGDAKIMARVGKAAAGLKYRRCDGKTAAAPGAPAAKKPSPMATGASMDNPKFRAAYFKALGDRAKTAWLATLEGPSPETPDVKIAGMTYSVLASCKSHDCYDHNLVVIYSPAKKVVYGKIHEAGKTTWIGSPPAMISKELDRLWTGAFRQN
jgi:hypothetical protein